MVDLSQLAERINKKWRGQVNALYTAEGVEVRWESGPCGTYRCDYKTHWSDIANASFIIWGLERLSELSDEYDDFYLGEDCVLLDTGYDRVFTESKTKAEAVATALYEVLGGEV